MLRPLVLLLLLLPITTMARLPSLFDTSRYNTIDLNDYIYVMLGNDPIYKDRRLQMECVELKKVIGTVSKDCEDNKIDTRYKATGLYKKGGYDVLWQGGRFDGAYLSNDARYFIGIPEDHDEVKFYRDYKLMATYEFHDLVDDNFHNVNWNVKNTVDEESHIYSMTTIDNNYYRFDLNSGRIIHYEQFPEWQLIAKVTLRSGKRINGKLIAECSTLDRLAKSTKEIRENSLQSDKTIVLHQNFSTPILPPNWDAYGFDQIPLTDIAQMSLQGKGQGSYWMWNVRVRNKNHMARLLSNDYHTICVTNGGKPEQRIKLSDIRSMSISPAFIKKDRVSPPPGLRMRWDKNSVAESGKAYCLALSNRIYDNPHDNKRLLEYLSLANCRLYGNSHLSLLTKLAHFALKTEPKKISGSLISDMYAISLKHERYLDILHGLSAMEKYLARQKKRGKKADTTEPDEYYKSTCGVLNYAEEIDAPQIDMAGK